MQTSDEEAERSLDSRVVVMNDRRERRLAHLKSLNVADLAKKSHKTRDTKYRLYLWNILTISLFYALPVVQLVLVWAKQVRSAFDYGVLFILVLGEQGRSGLMLVQSLVRTATRTDLCVQQCVQVGTAL